MTVFRALVVDDDEWVREKGDGASVPDQGIEVLTAATKEEAAEMIAANFLHVAVVDLELKKGARGLGEGRMVLRGLMKARPSCRRVLLTAYATTFPERVFEMLKPDNPVVYGAIDKDKLGEYFHRYVRSLADSWRRATVEISNIDEVYDLLRQKSIRGGTILGDWKVEVTRDELQYVLASLFGQRFRAVDDTPDPDDVEKVTLDPFLGGKSRSIVLHGRPLDRLGGEGLLCVVKIGPRADAEQELRRYEQYVRFRMSLHRRVELLDHALGDTVGAIAYSFAGQDPSEVGDLQTLIDGCDPRSFAHFDEVYGEGSAWGPEGEEGDDLGEFFGQAYKLNTRAVRTDIELFADDLATRYGWTHRRNELLLPGGKLVLPSDENMGTGLLHMDYRTTIAHGDLNGSNVILGDGGRSILIDYRHTARGPRALDYASMQASVRLGISCRDRPADQAALDEGYEYRLWQHNWRTGDEWWPSASPDEPPYWLVAAAHLMRLTAERLPDLTRAEHAATCWLYALRVFRVRDLDKDTRLRLLIWISALDRVLADEGSAAS
jgi:CheY-like chemotaxis protein